jgi:putative transcriptional regulator
MSDIINKLDKGKLLLSDPFLLDPYFRKTAILLTHYAEDGAVGFIINKKTNFLLSEMIQEEIFFDTEVYYGGPVENNNLYYLHTLGDLIPESIEVAPGIFWSGNFEELISYTNIHGYDKEKLRFFVGYSGWASGQLEDEIRSKSWLVNDLQLTGNKFSWDDKSLWADKIGSMSKEISMWKNAPDDPNLN